MVEERLRAWWSAPNPPMVTLRTVYVRLIALVNAVALVSFAVQAEALIGDDGILPVVPWLEAIAQRTSIERYWEVPTLLWFLPTSEGLWALIALGLLLSMLLMVGVAFEGPLLLGLWIVQISLGTAGQLFYNYQWDTLLVEATFTTMFVARWLPMKTEPVRWAWWLQWWLVFRLMFFGGLVKLTSGDETWWNFTALDVHFWTQPLPNPLSRTFHLAPTWFHAAGVGLTFLVELVFPFLIPFGRRARRVAFVGFAVLMGALATTGNYGFFQLLSVVLALSLLDDDVFPLRLRERIGRADRYGWHLGLPVALAAVGISTLWMTDYSKLSRPSQVVLEKVAPFSTVNRYGLFAVMTTDRIEVVLEGSFDGTTWRELPFRYKPGALDRVPPQIAPHMPRVDWQLWFAGLGTCRQNPWLVHLMRRVIEGSEPVQGLFVPGTFDDGTPRAVRAQGYRYTFTELGATDVWAREALGPYCPSAVTR